MKVLLDTQILIWSVSRPDKLSAEWAAKLASQENNVFFSAVSIWEVAIKFALGRPDFTLQPASLIAYAQDAEFRELAVTSSAAARVAELPHHHRDPFDRLLIAQAMDESAVLFTADIALAAYGPHVVMVG